MQIVSRSATFDWRRAKTEILLPLILQILMFFYPISGETASWNPTGTLTTSRIYHTATLLPDGKVLVVGGMAENSYLRSAELYDPTTRVWSPTALLAHARSAHTATLLSNGKVLVAGGENGLSSHLNDVELYDPATNSWNSLPPLNFGRRLHTATLLGNGKVLVAGGIGSGYLYNHELYDPATNSWSHGGTSVIGRSHTATMLPSGKVLVVGGRVDVESLSSAMLYDPATNSWSLTGTLSSGRYDHTATLLRNGLVLVTGGFSIIPPTEENPASKFVTLNNAELYEPFMGTWSPAASLAHARSRHTATLLRKDKALVIGGESAVAELYDAAANTWSYAGDVGGFNTATLLLNGMVLVVGNSCLLYQNSTTIVSVTSLLLGD